MAIPPIVRLCGVTKSFASDQGPVPVLREVSLSIDAQGAPAEAAEEQLL